MTVLDGWVGEQVSTDPSVVPDLESPPLDLALPVLAPESSPSGDPNRTKKLAARGLACLVVMGVGLLVLWGVLSLLETDELPTVVVPRTDVPSQRLVVGDNTLYLEGSVPDEETSTMFEEMARDAIGDERVVNHLELDPEAFFDPHAPLELTLAQTVLFGSGQASVSERYGLLIDFGVELLAFRDSVTLSIIGHTDDIGGEKGNLDLSIRRARATRDELIARGADRTRLSVDGMGEGEPIASNDTEQGRARNRRVEFLVSGLFD